MYCDTFFGVCSFWRQWTYTCVLIVEKPAYINSHKPVFVCDMYCTTAYCVTDKAAMQFSGFSCSSSISIAYKCGHRIDALRWQIKNKIKIIKKMARLSLINMQPLNGWDLFPALFDRQWCGPLTPSLPLHVKFAGWKMQRRACKQYIFRSYDASNFNAVRLDENPFTCQCEKKTKRLKGFKFSISSAVFRWHHGSEGVKLHPESFSWKTGSCAITW